MDNPETLAIFDTQDKTQHRILKKYEQHRPHQNLKVYMYLFSIDIFYRLVTESLQHTELYWQEPFPTSMPCLHMIWWNQNKMRSACRVLIQSKALLFFNTLIFSMSDSLYSLHANSLARSPGQVKLDSHK
jgi:hypothetical protein